MKSITDQQRLGNLIDFIEECIFDASDEELREDLITANIDIDTLIKTGRQLIDKCLQEDQSNFMALMKVKYKDKIEWRVIREVGFIDFFYPRFINKPVLKSGEFALYDNEGNVTIMDNYHLDADGNVTWNYPYKNSTTYVHCDYALLTKYGIQVKSFKI